MPGLLDRQRTIAPPGFNRWLVPPAALCIHLCIGMAYGFSVFWLPLTKAVGITAPISCPDSLGVFAKLTTTAYDWDKPQLGWMYTLFFVFLGSSAAIFGSWLERAGPRKAGVAAAVCWCGGLVVSAAGVYWHQLWLLWLGAGVIGGIGLGLGYISPVSTLIKWFPDRRGLATGMAIMGFGGGAMVGSPLADRLMKHFAGPTSVGVWQTFLALAAIYFVFMMIGSFAYRVPPEGWSPPGWSLSGRPPGTTAAAARQTSLSAADACRTPQFWLLWLVLCLNVSAGIGVIGMASPMLQEIFGGRLLGTDVAFDDLDAAALGRVAAIGAGFTGLLSLFNILGRFFRLARQEDHLRVVFPARHAAVRRSTCRRPHRQRAAVLRRTLPDHHDVRWWICGDPSVSGRPVRIPVCRGDPWPAPHCVERRGSPRSGPRELRQRAAGAVGRAPRRGLRPDDDPAGGPARDRLRLQSAGSAAGSGRTGGYSPSRCLFITDVKRRHRDTDSFCRQHSRATRGPLAPRGAPSGLGPLDLAAAGVAALRVRATGAVDVPPIS